MDEGDTVKKGQVIARLDRDQLMAQRDATGRRPRHRPRRNSPRPKPRSNGRSADLAGDIEQRHADLASSEAHLAELKNGSRPQEKQDAQAAVEAAQSELDRAKNDWDRAQTLYKNDDISTAAVRSVPQALGERRCLAQVGQGARRAGAGRPARGSHRTPPQGRWRAPRAR